MVQSIMKPVGLAMALVSSAALALPAMAQTPQSGDETLAAETLSAGESIRAISMLRTALEEQPNDPALLINLGIAYAQSGNDAEARASFEAAFASRTVIELETANGDSMDSQRLARRALGMLERGEFRETVPVPRQLTLRD